ncbi:uncharacterized protein METZ01_LOCUS280332, partial [marine metagenome]
SKNARIGRAEVGGWPASNNYAYFGNQNLNHGNAGNYALLQSADGHTFLNAVSGKMLRFRINNSDKMMIASNGNVGIGTTSPGAKFVVNGGEIQHKRYDHTSHFQYSTNGDNYIRSGKSAGKVILQDTGGKVGIGHSAPTEMLDVNGNIFTNGQVTAYGHMWTGQYLNMTGASSQLRWSAYGGGFQMTENNWIRITGDKDFHWGQNSEARGGYLGLDSGGNYSKLFNSDDGIIFYVRDSNHGRDRYVRWDGDSNLDQYSDRRLKQDIEDEKNILERIMQIRVRNFYWKDYLEAPNKTMGLIAQEVEPHFPHLVGEMKNPETDITYKTLGSSDFGILAFGGVRELKLEKDREIESLKAELEKMAKELKRVVKLLEN